MHIQIPKVIALLAPMNIACTSRSSLFPQWPPNAWMFGDVLLYLLVTAIECVAAPSTDLQKSYRGVAAITFPEQQYAPGKVVRWGSVPCCDAVTL